MGRWFLPLIVAAVVISRIPLLTSGYGSDGDGWRVAWSASMLWHGDSYQPSRFPGFPVYEMLSAPLVGLGGSLLSNAGTLAAFVAALLLFHQLLGQWEVPSTKLLTVTFAFLPILWKNSAVTMDYCWGLCGILAAFVLAARRRYLLAAALIGIAAGTRITHVVFLLPIAVLLDHKSWARSLAGMACMTAGATVICYLPVLLRPGLMPDVLKYLADVRSYPFSLRLGFFAYRSIYSVGLLGAAAAVGALAASLPAFRMLLRDFDRRFVASLLALAVMGALFFMLSDEREYLIPAMPFLLIILGKILRPAYLRVVAVLLLSYSFISFDLATHQFGRQHLTFRLSPGMLIFDAGQRSAQMALRQSLAGYPPADSSIVMTAWGPVLWLENPGVAHSEELERMFGDPDVARSLVRPHVYYVYSLPLAETSRFRQEGYRIYYLEGAREYLESFLHYDLVALGVAPFHPHN